MHTQPNSIDQLLSERFRGRSLPPEYRAVVQALLAGRSMLLVTPDADRRRLTWHLAAAMGRRPVLVVTPSAHGLARRAEKVADRAGLVTCRIDAEMAGTGLATLSKQLRDGRWDAALVSARHLGDPSVMEAARALEPKLFVVEDAYGLSRHGRRYHPSMARAVPLAMDADCTLALSDVAELEARHEIADSLDIREDPVVTGLDLLNVRLEVRNTPGQSKRDAHLLGLMNDGPERAIVFVGLRVDAERLAWLIEDQCGVPTLDMTGRSAEEFAAALGRFREGSARVMVATGALTARHDWPDVPLVVAYALPDSLEMLHRQLRLATGPDARGVLLYDRSERNALERRHMRCAPEAGHLLAIHAAIEQADRTHYGALSTLTGLHPDEVHIGVEALVSAGAVRVRARADDWLEAEAADGLTDAMLTDCAREALALREARLAKGERSKL